MVLVVAPGTGLYAVTPAQDRYGWIMIDCYTHDRSDARSHGYRGGGMFPVSIQPIAIAITCCIGFGTVACAMVQTPATSPRVPTIGDTISKGDWEVTLRAYGRPGELASPDSMPPNSFIQPEGVSRMVAEFLTRRTRSKAVSVSFTATNVGKQPITVTVDALRLIDSADRQFAPLIIPPPSFRDAESRALAMGLPYYFGKSLEFPVTLQPGFSLSQPTREGSIARDMVTFDIDPAAKGLKFRFYDIVFQLPE
jgi:hypothetical protein